MEMQQVRYFLALAQTLNFTRAAEDCNVSQPALTRAIKQLEDELGGELIRREGRRSHLTELGNRMRPLLAQCYEGALAAKLMAKAVAKGETACITIAISRSLDIALLMKPLGELFRHFPGLQLKLRRGSGESILEMLQTGGVDIAVGGPLRQYWDRLEAWPMFTESFDLVVGPDHPLAGHNEPEIEVELFRDLPLLLHSGAETTEADHIRLREAGIDLASAHEVDSDHDLESLVRAGIGVGLVPASSLRGPTLHHLHSAALNIERTVAVYSVAGRQRSRETATLLSLLRAADWGAAALA